MSEQAQRELILELFSKSLSATAIAKKLEGVVHRATVFRTVKAFKESGKTQWKPSSRKLTVKTATMVKRMREKIRCDPRQSMRRMTKDEGVSKTTMWRVCRQDLGMTPYKKQRWQVLSEDKKAKHLHQGRQLLKILKDGTMLPILWTDKKLFTVEAVHNVQNDRVLGTSKETLGTNVLSHFLHHGLGRRHLRGKKTPLIFIEEGVKINTAVYLHLLSEEVAPWVELEFVFQQDGAPSHTSNLTQSFCEAVFLRFWSKELWPPSSPDLNVMDFSI